MRPLRDVFSTEGVANMLRFSVIALDAPLPGDEAEETFEASFATHDEAVAYIESEYPNAWYEENYPRWNLGFNHFFIRLE
jgi:hypothetical protein